MQNYTFGLQTSYSFEYFHTTGHVIPPEHLLAVALEKGPSGMELDFTYQSRDSPQLVSVVVFHAPPNPGLQSNPRDVHREY